MLYLKFSSELLIFIANSGVGYGSDYFYTYDGSQKIILGPHEYTHIEQAYWLGPLYLPVYLLSGGVGYWNWMEKQADRKGNELWRNTPKN